MPGNKNRPPAVTAAPEKGDKFYAAFANLDEGLTCSAQNVLLALIWHCNAKTGRCDPSVSRLACETGQSKRQVYRAIKELEAAQLIVRIRHAGGAFCNAYAVQWAELRNRYQQWLTNHGLTAKTPDIGDIPPLTQVSRSPDAGVAQTIGKPEKEMREEIRSSSSSSPKRDDASRLGIQREYGGEALPPLNFLVKPKAPSSKVAREKAHQRLDEDLRNHLSADAYADFVGCVDSATVEKAIIAEVRKPGAEAGVRLALAEMHRKLSTVTTIANATDGFPEIPKFLRRTRV
jgi:hypothetical protein